MARKCLNNPVQINTDILIKWLTERGKQPVTWATLVEVLHDIELSTLLVISAPVSVLLNSKQQAWKCIHNSSYY